ncbi:MAG: hypothetical protein JW819_05150 [Candidatus Krumholzibacteriota bacterium]|nr:hypothetical protein [Candidatus Krumholzibacteriota bacterium]
MAGSRVRITITQSGRNYQVRIQGYGARDLKKLKARLNIDPAPDALRRMDEYEDLRCDDFFEAKGRQGKELGFTCGRGRLAMLRELADEEGYRVEAGADLLPDSDEAQRMVSRKDSFADELSHIVEANQPFYRRGPAALLTGLAVRVVFILVLLGLARGAYLIQADNYQPRSLQAIMKTVDEPYVAQNPIAHFFRPEYTHQSALKIRRPLYIRGNRVILDAGFYVMIEGIQNLKASIERHNNAPVTIKIDTREGRMSIHGIYVGGELITHKGELIVLGRVPVSPQPPQRLDTVGPGASGRYVRVRDADPQEEATFNWMLGQAVSVTARLTRDGDRYLIGEDEFKFAIPRESVREDIREIIDMAADNNERAIVDMRLSSRPYPLRNRRDPRDQRRGTNIITDGRVHYVTVQSAILKNI